MPEIAEMRVQEFMREADNERLILEAVSGRGRVESTLKRIVALVTLLGL